MSTAKERRDAADRARYDGLVLQEVNILLRAARYRDGFRKLPFQRLRDKFVREGYWDPSTETLTERGRSVQRIAYGISLQPVEQAIALIEARRTAPPMPYREIKRIWDAVSVVHSKVRVEVATALSRLPEDQLGNVLEDFDEGVVSRLDAYRRHPT